MRKRKTKEEFISEAKRVHGDKYDYSKVEYKQYDKKVCIVCSVHGKFWQTPHNHLNGQNCPKCVHKSNKYTVSEFIQEAKKVHGDKYDYSKVEYKNNKEKVCIICPIHGEFWIRPNNHLEGQGCNQCGITKIKQKNTSTLDEFIKKSKNIHGDKYDYSKVEYKNNKEKVCIICSIHGEFWQTPANHLSGHGCQRCNASSLESEIYEKLKKMKIDVIPQKRFKWLGLKSLDFYLPNYNIAIECQGIQHFIPSKYEKSFFNDKKVTEIKTNDEEKRLLCELHGVKIFYYSNLGIEYPYKVYENANEMLKDIVNNKDGIEET